jgi:prolipoprotein diacylglyceryltransferase
MRNGFLFSWSLIILFSLRFIDEFFKLNQAQFEDGMILNMGQILSIPFILTGIVMLILIAGKTRETISSSEIVVDGEKS